MILDNSTMPGKPCYLEIINGNRELQYLFSGAYRQIAGNGRSQEEKDNELYQLIHHRRPNRQPGGLPDVGLTMTRVALPEMSKHKRSDALASGFLAAGGTLAILIPPLIVLIIYALLTEQNIVKLFLAATIPGTLAVTGFMNTIAIYVRLKPGKGPAQPRASLSDRPRSLREMWHTVGIFVIVRGDIYGGFFTPAEGCLGRRLSDCVARLSDQSADAGNADHQSD